MKFVILRRTSDYRGDHSADVSIAYDVVPGETVEAMMGRVLDRGPVDATVEVVEIRVVRETP